MAAVFMIGTAQELLNTLGIKYGFMFGENFMPLIVIQTGTGLEETTKLLKKGLITAQEARQMRSGITETGISKSMSELMDIVNNFRLPVDFMPEYTHKMCETCGIPFPHGYAVDSRGRRHSEFELVSKDSAIVSLMSVVQAKKMPVLEAIHLLKQVFESGIPLDQDEVERLRHTLPPPEVMVLDLLERELRGDRRDPFGR